MVTLISLPQEVLIDIAKELPRASLHALTMTCWYTHEAANPVLWRELRFAADKSDYEDEDGLNIHGPYLGHQEHLDRAVHSENAAILVKSALAGAVRSETLNLIRHIAILTASRSQRGWEFDSMMSELFEENLLSGVREIKVESTDRTPFSAVYRWRMVQRLVQSITNFIATSERPIRLKMAIVGAQSLRVLITSPSLAKWIRELHLKCVGILNSMDFFRKFCASTEGIDTFECHLKTLRKPVNAWIDDLQSLTGLSCAGFTAVSERFCDNFRYRLWVPTSFELNWTDEFFQKPEQDHGKRRSEILRLYFLSKKSAASLPSQYVRDGSGLYFPEGFDARVLAATPECVHIIVNDLSHAAISVLASRRNYALRTLSVRCCSKDAYHTCDTASFGAIISASPNLRFLLFSAQRACKPTDGFVGRVLDQCPFLETMIVEPYVNSPESTPLKVGEEAVTIPLLSGNNKRQYFKDWVLHYYESLEIMAECDADSDKRLRPGAAAWFEIIHKGERVRTTSGLFSVPADAFSLDVAGLHRHLRLLAIEGDYEPWPKAEIV